MRNKMGLTRTQRQVPILPPAKHAFRRHPRRIVLSPDSANAEKKDWSPEGFLRLAHTLEQHGYTPYIRRRPSSPSGLASEDRRALLAAAL